MFNKYKFGLFRVLVGDRTYDYIIVSPGPIVIDALFRLELC